jgi:hypothetical protein
VTVCDTCRPARISALAKFWLVESMPSPDPPAIRHIKFVSVIGSSWPVKPVLTTTNGDN